MKGLQHQHQKERSILFHTPFQPGFSWRLVVLWLWFDLVCLYSPPSIFFLIIIIYVTPSKKTDDQN